MTDILETGLTPLEEARHGFRRELLDAGLLIASASAGVYGRSATFEAVLTGLDRVLTELTAPLNATALRFPPVYPRADFELTDYIASFPDLSGVVSSFEGGDREHRELLAAREAGERWDGYLTPADVVLTNAICHPLYATLRGRMPAGGGVYDILGWGFRHEPSADPMRMQSFRMHEFVYVGEPDAAQEYRDTWLDKAVDALSGLGLPVTPVAANDPFFGRAGRMLVSEQLRDNLKVELTVPMYGDLHEGTAIASANCQRDHLTAAFGIRTAGGEVAHGACLAFGMERTVLALLRVHGLDVNDWPLDVRARLAL
ncbi:MAG: amino acid--[acyl-carrier-protein] ligase [Microbacteriaceae bacterium]|nr:amino acid--[acyl-carrier-protein] ligase [Microbacteriaceae bacterium]